MPPARSENARLIARWFGLPVHEKPLRGGRHSVPAGLAPPLPGQIILITGPSGSGKSLLLRALARRSDAKVMNLNQIRLARLPCVDQFGDDISIALDLLSRVGLAEAFTWMQLPRELSDGQRWRLRLALGIAHASRCDRAVLVLDEFCAILDRVTAAVVARALRRTIDRLNEAGRRLGAIVATSHDDLGAALLPDVEVCCDFGADSVRLRAERSGTE